jgi:hypothetical protein
MHVDAEHGQTGRKALKDLTASEKVSMLQTSQAVQHIGMDTCIVFFTRDRPNTFAAFTEQPF